MIGLTRILTILYFSICLPIRWLAGNAHKLAEYDFSALDMGWALDLMNSAFKEITDDGRLMLEEDYMMHIFDPIAEKVTAFAEYMGFMFDEKQANLVGSRHEEDRVFPFHLVREEVFYPKRAEVRQTNKICATLATEAAATFLAEFCVKSKATHNYLSEACGIRSQAKLSSKEREASLGLHATNNTSESGHGCLTGAIQTWGSICEDHAAAEAMIRVNNDVGRGYEALVTGRKAKDAPVERVFGTLHKLPAELRESLIQAARENAPAARKSFDAALQ